jgi:tRNA-modifying protein YgfZ
MEPMKLEAAVFADRSERAKLRFTGPQRAWFLDQVLTQAIQDLSPGQARDAAMITVHGRMTAYLELLATEDALLAHAEPELADVLLEQLRRYVFATQVDIEDVGAGMGLVLVAGPGWQSAARSSNALLHPTTALGEPAAYLWVESNGVARLVDHLEGAGLRRALEDELEAVRIANGAPRWGRDMNEKTLPQEAGIDDVAVHYDKGCYLGQEAMAKIHFRGKVNRRLRRLAATGGLEPQSEVVLAGDRVGRVTSVADGFALAMLRRTVEAGTTVDVGGVEATVLE